jgi:hypothetical protein
MYQQLRGSSGKLLGSKIDDGVTGEISFRVLQGKNLGGGGQWRKDFRQLQTKYRWMPFGQGIFPIGFGRLTNS